MYLKELIEKLQKQLDNYGDLPVVAYCNRKAHNIDLVTTAGSYNGKLEAVNWESVHTVIWTEEEDKEL